MDLWSLETRIQAVDETVLEFNKIRLQLFHDIEQLEKTAENQKILLADVQHKIKAAGRLKRAYQRKVT